MRFSCPDERAGHDNQEAAFALACVGRSGETADQAVMSSRDFVICVAPRMTLALSAKV
jgi:hypothetical protein